MSPATEIAFTLCTDAEAFRRLTEQWAHSSELWIDTETADWWTSHPRLSLLQVRTPEGCIHVVDVLAPGAREVLDTAFVTWRERLATHLDPEAWLSRDWYQPDS